MSFPSPADLSAWGAPMPPRGAALLTDPLLNKGTAFTERERDALGLRGLLPPRIFTLEEQAKILAAGRSNNELDTSKLTALYPDIQDIHTGMRALFARMKLKVPAGVKCPTHN